MQVQVERHHRKDSKTANRQLLLRIQNPKFREIFPTQGGFLV